MVFCDFPTLYCFFSCSLVWLYTLVSLYSVCLFVPVCALQTSINCNSDRKNTLILGPQVAQMLTCIWQVYFKLQTPDASTSLWESRKFCFCKLVLTTGKGVSACIVLWWRGLARRPDYNSSLTFSMLSCPEMQMYHMHVNNCIGNKVILVSLDL